MSVYYSNLIDSFINNFTSDGIWKPGNNINDINWPKSPSEVIPELSTWMDTFENWNKHLNNSKDAFYAMNFVCAVHSLGNGEIDGVECTDPEGFDISYIRETMKLFYPGSNTEYDCLENGLMKYFGLKIPHGNHGRLFKTVLNRLSGLNYTRYTQKYFDLEIHRRSETEILNLTIREIGLTEDSDGKVGETVRKLWVALNRLYNELSAAEFMSDELRDVIVERIGINYGAASRVEKILQDNYEKFSGDKTPDFPESISVVYENGRIKIEFPSSIRTKISTKEIKIYYPITGTSGGYSLICTYHLDKSRTQKDYCYYRTSTNHIQEFAPPSLNIMPLSFYWKSSTGESFTQDYRLIKTIRTAAFRFRDAHKPMKLTTNLRAGSSYKFIGLNGYIITKFNLDNKELPSESGVVRIPRDGEELMLLGKSPGGDRDVFLDTFLLKSALQRPLNITGETISDFHWKTFTSQPQILISPYVACDSVEIKNIEHNESCRVSNPEASVLPEFDMSIYGSFEVSLNYKGNSFAHASYKVLPPDFKKTTTAVSLDVDQEHVLFSSSEIERLTVNERVYEGRGSCIIEPLQTKISGKLIFRNGFTSEFNGLFYRRGVVVQLGEEYSLPPEKCTNSKININDLLNEGKLHLFGKPGSITTVIFKDTSLRERNLLLKLSFIIPDDGLFVFDFSEKNILENTSVDAEKFAWADIVEFENRPSPTETGVRTKQCFKSYNTLSKAPDISLECRTEEKAVKYHEGKLLLEHDISDLQMERGIFVVMLPVFNQHKLPIPAISPDGYRLHNNFKRISGTSLEIATIEGDRRQLIISDPEGNLVEKPHICFIFSKSRYGYVVRLSGGSLITFTMNPSNLTNFEQTLWDFRNPSAIAALFSNQQMPPNFIPDFRCVARFLNAHNYLNNINHKNSNFYSGFIFRDYRYWLSRIYIENESEFVFEYWDFELFGYSEFFDWITNQNNDLEIVLNLEDMEKGIQPSVCFMSILSQQPDGHSLQSILNGLNQVISEYLNENPQENLINKNVAELLGEEVHFWRMHPDKYEYKFNQVESNLNSLKNRLWTWHYKNPLNNILIMIESIKAARNDGAFLTMNQNFIKKMRNRGNNVRI